MSIYLRTTLVIAFVVIAASVLQADVIHTVNGDEIECEILNDKGKAYRLRTRLGVVDLKKEEVKRVERKTSPWEEYRKRRRACKNTADAHFELAKWCDERDLSTERRDELEHAIKLDPDHEKAREALGFVRDERGNWVEPKSDRVPDDATLKARRMQKKQEQLLRKIVSEWFVKVRAIHDGRMSPKRRKVTREKFMKARDLILDIQDPLAIPALTGVLSTGTTASRLVLVESLSNFADDDATMNLLVMSLLDPADEVRKEAAKELGRREDARVVDRLRDALESEEEGIIRHAATALGIIGAKETVADLVAHLSIEKLATVRVTRPVYLGQIYGTFCGPTHVINDRGFIRYDPDGIGVMASGTMLGTDTYFIQDTVSVYRTEVQEALIAITGQNFGFDENAWLEWWEKNKPRR